MNAKATTKESAGLLMFRRRASGLEVLLVHPGGPYWQRKEDGAWSLPKGEPEPDEEALAAAKREFAEETGLAPKGPFIPLGTVRQTGGKHVHGFAFEGDCDPASITSNSFEMEWPPHSGKMQSFPEIDRAAWFGLAEAHGKINKAQAAFLDALEAHLSKT
jgi:predicted NUDIX family NTP pyrophosphohydrolase